MWFHKLFRSVEDINTLSFLVEESLNSDNHQLKINDLRTKSKELLLLLRKNKRALSLLSSYIKDQEVYNSRIYLAGSMTSAINKANDVISTIKNHNLEFYNYGYISLGGGDGTEMYHSMENLGLNYGLLLDYDNASIRKASDKLLNFKIHNQKTNEEICIDFIESDLLDPIKLNIAKKCIKRQNLNGIIVSIHAVLHELYERSSFVRKEDDKKNVLDMLFQEIFEWHQNIFIIIREPGIVENWTKSSVLIELEDEYHEKFNKILEDIKSYYFKKDDSQTFSYRKEKRQFFCGSQLAIEALTKLFYYEDYNYEKQERQTSISQEAIQLSLSSGGNLFEIVETNTFFTQSVKRNMEKFGIKIRDTKNTLLSPPQCFSYIIAQKINK